MDAAPPSPPKSSSVPEIPPTVVAHRLFSTEPPLSLFRSVKSFVMVSSLIFSAYLGSIFLMAPCFIFLFLNVQLFRNYCDWLANIWFRFPSAFLELWMGLRFIVTGDKAKPSDNEKMVIYIANHRTRLDWFFFWSYVLRAGNLSTEKIVLKKELMYVPGFGWATQMFRFFFLSRKWESDEKWLTTLLRSFCETNYPLQMLLFPEGTDYDQKTLERSYLFAKKENLPQYYYVLHPRTRGFQHIISILRNNISAVYDVTFAYPDCMPQNGSALFTGRLPTEVHLDVKRYEINDLPVDDEGVAKWCQERFAEKEVALKKFYQTGKFEGSRVDFPDCTAQLVQSLCFWYSFIFLAFYGLLNYSWMSWFFIFGNLVFLYVTHVAGGAERLELAALESNKKKEK